jgi:hypothetical protein
MRIRPSHRACCAAVKLPPAGWRLIPPRLPLFGIRKSHKQSVNLSWTGVFATVTQTLPPVDRDRHPLHDEFVKALHSSSLRRPAVDLSNPS